MPVPTQISMCNGALGRIRAGSIADINENSLAAQECRLYYPMVISEMLEMHDWSFANQRVQLAEAGTNDRVFEWLFAYLMPANCAQPIRVLPDLASAGIAIPQPLPGQPYSETWATLNGYAVPYEVLDGILFTNAEKAWLDYTINDITGIAISATCAKAIRDDLAERLLIPLKGDLSLLAALTSAREVSWREAIAIDRNRQPADWGNYESEAMIARHSGAIGVPIDSDYP